MNRLLRNALIMLGVALVLTAAGLAAVLGPAEAPAENAARPQIRYAMIAARPIAAGERIDNASLGWRALGAGPVPAGALVRDGADDGRAQAEVIGAIAQRNLAPGELLNEQAFAKAPPVRTLAASLNPGWRAVTIAADASQAAAGLILPNDRVDVLLAEAKEDAGTPRITLPFAKMGGPALTAGGTMISNLRVIAVNGLMAPSDPASAIVDESAKSGGTITLEVPAAQVALIASAATNGQLVIALRSRLDHGGPAAQVGPALPEPSAPVKKKADPKRQRSAGEVAVSSPGFAPVPDPQSVTVIRGRGAARDQ